MLTLPDPSHTIIILSNSYSRSPRRKLGNKSSCHLEHKSLDTHKYCIRNKHEHRSQTARIDLEEANRKSFPTIAANDALVVRRDGRCRSYGTQSCQQLAGQHKQNGRIKGSD